MERSSPQAPWEPKDFAWHFLLSLPSVLGEQALRPAGVGKGTCQLYPGRHGYETSPALPLLLPCSVLFPMGLAGTPTSPGLGVGTGPTWHGSAGDTSVWLTVLRISSPVTASGMRAPMGLVLTQGPLLSTCLLRSPEGLPPGAPRVPRAGSIQAPGRSCTCRGPGCHGEGEVRTE